MIASNDVSLSITVIIYTLGVCTMLPWNFFITANSYWQYKLRNTTLGDNWDDSDVELTRMQLAFTPALVIFSNLFCFIFAFLTSAITKRVSEKVRIVGSLFLSLAAMGVVTALAIIDTDDWQVAFFGITLLLVSLLNIGIAILQASLYGIIGLFPPSSVSALVSGQSLAGVISSLAQVISLAIGDADPVVSGIIYFCIADVFLIISTWSYFKLIRMDYYKNNIVGHVGQENLHEKESVSKESEFKQYIKVFKKIFWMGFTLGFVLLVTLSVFPAVQVYVTSRRSPSTWADVYFQPVITFLVFNTMDMFGRELPRYIQWPSYKGYLFHCLSASRILFIPLIMFCFGENKTFPTLFYSDSVYIIINILFALTNGYFGALAMVYYPKLLEKDEVELGGTFMAAMMGAGMVIGSCLSPGFVALWGPNDG